MSEVLISTVFNKKAPRFITFLTKTGFKNILNAECRVQLFTHETLVKP